MMYNRDDFKFPEKNELLQFLPIVIFIGLVAPVILGAYSLAAVMKLVGWANT